MNPCFYGPPNSVDYLPLRLGNTWIFSYNRHAWGDTFRATWTGSITVEVTDVTCGEVSSTYTLTETPNIAHYLIIYNGPDGSIVRKDTARIPVQHSLKEYRDGTLEWPSTGSWLNLGLGRRYHPATADSLLRVLTGSYPGELGTDQTYKEGIGPFIIDTPIMYLGGGDALTANLWKYSFPGQ